MCDSVVESSDGKIQELSERPKPKTYISWMPSNVVVVEVWVYNNLFSVKWTSNVALQFERLGYFVVDYETTYDHVTDTGKMIFNRTVSLKEEVFKKALTEAEKQAVSLRATNAQNAVAAKEARMQIDPPNFFREAEEFKGKYSKYNDETGIPTHDSEGVELTKSMMKRLDKEKQKHAKQLMRWKESQEKK